MVFNACPGLRGLMSKARHKQLCTQEIIKNNSSKATCWHEMAEWMPCGFLVVVVFHCLSCVICSDVGLTTVQWVKPPEMDQKFDVGVRTALINPPTKLRHIHSPDCPRPVLLCTHTKQLQTSGGWFVCKLSHSMFATWSGDERRKMPASVRW